MTLIYTLVRDAADWRSLTSERDNSRWFYDDELIVAVPPHLADGSADVEVPQ